MEMTIKSEGTYRSALFKGNPKTLINNKAEMPICFELININDIYFFARELVTRELFPIFSINKVQNEYHYNTYSYIYSGNYYVYAPIEGNNEVLKYTVMEDNAVKPFYEADTKEIEKYLHTYEDELGDRKITYLKKCAESNSYAYDYNKIKELVNSRVISTDKKKKKVKINLKDMLKYGYDLSTQSNLCDVIGRKEELKKIIKALCIKEKSVVLVGESGSGKTSLVEKLALDINNNEWLNNKIIFYLNTAQVISGTRFRGEFEENLNEIIDFCKNNKGRIILFIDEFHTLYGLGRANDSSIDAIQILKPYINSGDITIIGATTKEEYEKYITKDSAFCRRFDKIEVSIPDRELNHQIILAYIKILEKKYKIKLNTEDKNIDDIIDYILDITDVKCQKAIEDVKIQNPTLAKNVIEDAFVEAKYNHQKKVLIKDISMAIINCDRISSNNRKDIASMLKNELINNKKVVELRKIKELK